MFRLEPVLQQRAIKEEAAELALAQANSEYQRRLSLLESARQRLEEVSSLTGKDGLDLFEEMHLSLFRMSLVEEIVGQEKSVEEAHLMVEKKRKMATRARQERQVMEKLKIKHLQSYRREEDTKEQKEMDELALYSHLRRMKRLQPLFV